MLVAQEPKTLVTGEHMSLTHPWRKVATTISTIALVGSGLAIAAPAAQAASTLSGPSSASPSQQVTFTLASPPAGNLVLQDATGQGYAYVTAGLGDPKAFFTFNTPSTASQLVLGVADQSTGLLVSNTVPLTIGGVVGTTTAISAPNTAKLGQAVVITATVTSSGGSQYNPPGQVVITDGNNATITTMGLTNGPGAGQSYAYFNWTPQTAGSYIFKATYQPSAGSLATASSSNQDTLIATPSGDTISISAPPTFNQGTPVTLKASVYPSSVKGSVGFTINGAPISASIPLVNGTATFNWTPNVAGQVTLGASYTTTSGGSGSTSEVITIVGAPAASDVITLVQPGWGAWANGGSYNMGNGSNFTFQASTLSGAPVTLSETGPCVVSGLNLQVNSGSGVCNMKASSAGGNGYAPVTYGYTINLVPGTQVATLSAPPSGRYKVGRVLVLESPGQQDTNAGQNITWKLKKAGKKNCQLLYPNNGSVTLRIKSKGTCTVLGTAPGVAGQWLKFSTARKYTGR